MAKMPKEAMEVFNAEKAVKGLASVDAKGIINNVPMLSLAAIDEETLAFADLFIRKTKLNLNATKGAAAVAIVAPVEPGGMFKGYQAKGTFLGFQTSGPIYDVFRTKVKEQMKRGVRGVGLIKVEEVYEVTPGKGERVA